MQVSCTLMKSLYENKGQIVLTSEEMLFIYLDQPDPSSQMFFKKPKQGQKLYKLSLIHI